MFSLFRTLCLSVQQQPSITFVRHCCGRIPVPIPEPEEETDASAPPNALDITADVAVAGDLDDMDDSQYLFGDKSAYPAEN